MKNLFTLSQLIFGAFTFLVGLLAEVLGNMIAGGNWTILSVFAGLLVLAGLFVMVYRYTHPRHFDLRWSPPTPLRQPHEYRENAHRGLIFNLPLLDPQSPDKREITKEEKDTRKEAARNLDLACADLEHSNFRTAIEAAKAHAHRLQHVWLITTPDALPYAPVLEKYLKQQEKIACEIHYGDGYNILLKEDDDQVAVKTQKMVDLIYREAKKKGLSDKDIVADFTGGPRSMVLGIILACLDESRVVQMIGTHYDQNGKPQGVLPVLFDFEPKLTD